MSSWVHKVIPITPLIPITSTMTFRVRTADISPGHLVEAGLDKFWVRDSILSSVPEIKLNHYVAVYPNP